MVVKVIRKNEEKQKIFQDAVGEFYQKHPKADKAQVVIKEYKINRSTAQNNLLHMWIGIVAQELGYTRDAMKTILVEKFLGYEEVTTKSNKVIKTLRSTSKLKVDEFTEFLAEIDMFMAEWSITLPHPEDYHIAMGIKK